MRCKMTITECKYYRDKDKECDVWGIPCEMKDCYFKELKRLEKENFELKESLKCFQTPEAMKALTFYKTGEFKLQEKKCIELEQENERLKEEIKEVKKYQYEQEFLEKEIEEQREKNKRLTCKILEVKALNETLNVECTSQDCTQLRKLHQTLQEIKAIAETGMHCEGMGCDFMPQILELITKAASEG